MQKTIKISLTVVLAYAVGFMLAITIASAQAAAHEGEDHSEEVAQAQANEQPANQGENYSYKAQAGDSYSAIARKAVQTYGIENKVNLTQAGIVFAETRITNEANPGLLNEGQEVKISKETVKRYVEQAEKLTTAQQKAWAYYAQFVDFNTDKVGQAS